jgi:HSP20 family protein
MFFATTNPAQFRRPVHASTGHTLDRLLEESLRPTRNQGCAYTQDETSFNLSLDMPGITKDHLTIAVEGAVVRVTTKEGAPRSYRAAYELPQDIDTTASEAKLENGVLQLKLAKKVPVSNASELVIQ